MLKYLFLLASRNIYRDKVTTIINITGLTIALSVFILLTQYVKFERSYDDFHPDSEMIYRIIEETSLPDGSMVKNALTRCAFKLGIDDEIPEIVSSARIHPEQGVVTTKDNVSFRVKFNWIDPELLSFLNVKLIYGDAKTCLNETHTTILSESVAKKIFGEKNPVGETLLLSGDHLFTVTGVFEDMPENTHFDFNVFYSWATIDEKWGFMNTSWRGNFVYTYFKVAENTDMSVLQKKLNELLARNAPTKDEGSSKSEVLIQPIRDIHLKSDINTGKTKNEGGAPNVTILLIIAYALLLLAWLNSANLYAVKATEKSEDIKKFLSMGAKPRFIFMQFFMQIFLVNLLSLLLTVLLVVLLYPSVSNYISSNDFFDFSDLNYWIKVFFIIVTGVLCSSVYPFFIFYSGRKRVINRFHKDNSHHKQFTRKVLITIQLTTCLVLIFGFIVVNSQIRFMQNQDLGFELKQKLVLIGPNADELFENSELQKTFREELSGKLGNNEISVSGSVPGEQMLTRYELSKGTSFNEELKSEMPMNDVSEEYFPLYKISIIAGRNFDPDNFNEENSVILNQKALKTLGFTDPYETIGKKISFRHGKPKTIIGVVEDVHHLSLQFEKPPTIYFYWKNVFRWIRIDYYTIPVVGDAKNTVAVAEKLWKKFFPLEPFEYFFLDDFFNQQYKEEVRFSRFFGAFSIFTIVVICIGLFSLALFMIKIRSKEVGVRKVLGAKTGQIVGMMAKEYFWLIFIAALFFIPLSYYMMKNWLEDFAYRIDLKFLFFILSFITVSIITLFSVSFGTIMTARKKPVESIRYE